MVHMIRKERRSKVFKVISPAISVLLLLAVTFDLHYSILVGPFLDLMLLLWLMVAGLVITIANIAFCRFRKIGPYVPLIIIVSSGWILFNKSKVNFGHNIHFFLNKENLDYIEKESKIARIYEMTNLLRHYKRINAKDISNSSEYFGREEIEEVFGEYIQDNKLEIEKIVEIQEKLIDCGIISIQRTGDLLLLKVDGFVDNEYGYVKSFSKELKVGDILPSNGLTIVRLIKFENGWYFYYST